MWCFKCPRTLCIYSCIVVIIAVGLSVDYSVHVAHTFVTEEGRSRSRDESVKNTLIKIGPAVLNGGIRCSLIISTIF